MLEGSMVRDRHLIYSCHWPFIYRYWLLSSGRPIITRDRGKT